jgi:hypothetical protein
VKELGLNRDDVHGVAGIESVSKFNIEQIDKLYLQLIDFKKNVIDDQSDNPFLKETPEQGTLVDSK